MTLAEVLVVNTAKQKIIHAHIVLMQAIINFQTYIFQRNLFNFYLEITR